MAKPGNTGLTRIIRAWGFSMLGFRAAWRHESAFRQEAVLALLLAPLAFWIGRTPLEWSLLLGCLLLVMMVELLNSALEAVVDRIGDEPHELSGRAKDLGSAAVFLALLLTCLVWALLAYQRLAGLS
jgi:diacylglycerol kinase (ATP)